jgi:methylamine utilization protein MauE
MTYVALVSRCLIGLVFALSAFTKLRSGPAFRAFSAWVATLPLLPKGWRSVIAVVVVAAEAVTVLLVALPWTPVVGLVVAAAVLAAFTAGTFMAARSRAGAVPCQCFGPSSVPLGMPHAARNALLCAVAAAGAAGVGPVAGHLPGVALSLGLGTAAALPTIFLDDLIALFAGGGTALPAALTPRAAAQSGNRKVRS